MRKKVTLELEIETEFESEVYSRLGDLLANIEDSDFGVKSVKLDDSKPVINIPNLRSTDIAQGVSDAVKRTHHRSSW
jgi:hypothetical protein